MQLSPLFNFTIFSSPLEETLVAQSVKNLPTMQKTPVQFLGWEDSPGEGNGNPLQYSCLENPMDRGALQATVHEVSRVGHDLVTKPRQNPQIERKYLQTMRPRMG